MEEKFMVSDEIAAKIANRLFQLGISEDLFQSRANISFPLPQEKWEAELAIRSLDMAIVLNELSMQRSYHKHEDDDDEYAFWERFVGIY